MITAAWREFDYADKANTAPPDDQMVWVREDFYEGGVTIGCFDGYTFRVLPGGGDDCSVSWWAPIEYPNDPVAGSQETTGADELGPGDTLPDGRIVVDADDDRFDEETTGAATGGAE